MKYTITKLIDKVQYKLFLAYLFIMNSTTLSVFAEEANVQVDNLNQQTTNMRTAEALGGLHTALRYITIVSFAVGGIVSLWAFAINAYRQSKAMQQGNSSQSQQEWTQFMKLFKNIVIFTILIGILSSVIIIILNIGYDGLLESTP